MCCSSQKESFSLKSKVLWVLAALQPLNIKRSKCTHLTTRGALQWMQTFVNIIISILPILNTIKVVLSLFCEIPCYIYQIYEILSNTKNGINWYLWTHLLSATNMLWCHFSLFGILPNLMIKNNNTLWWQYPFPG